MEDRVLFLRAELIEFLRMGAETADLMQPGLAFDDGSLPSEAQILGCLRQLESEQIVRHRVQVLDEKTGGWDSIPEIARGDEEVLWWELTPRGQQLVERGAVTDLETKGTG